MAKYFELSTNCSQRNKKAISNMPFGEITSEFYFRHYKDGREYWNDTRVCKIKCNNFQEVFELVKWLRLNCSRVSVSRPEKIGIQRSPFNNVNLQCEYVFNQLHTMRRTYHFPSREKDPPWIREERKGISKFVINGIDVAKVVNGKLDLLFEAKQGGVKNE